MVEDGTAALLRQPAPHCLLQIDSQSALHIGVGAGVGAVALTLGIVGPERRLSRGTPNRRTQPARVRLRPSTRYGPY
jgi:hypothetical protein